MDWFERLTGFREGPYEETRANMAIDGSSLRSLVNGYLPRVSLNAD